MADLELGAINPAIEAGATSLAFAGELEPLTTTPGAPGSALEGNATRSGRTGRTGAIALEPGATRLPASRTVEFVLGVARLHCLTPSSNILDLELGATLSACWSWEYTT